MSCNVEKVVELRQVMDVQRFLIALRIDPYCRWRGVEAREDLDL